MRLDFCKMTSATGGVGALTCSAQTGFPLVSNAFTGTRLVDYSIAEYTTSGKTVLSKGETGVGSYNTATEILTRTKVLSTWDGTVYLPKFGTATAPTAISFGTTAANIDIMVSPMAGGIIPPIPFVYGAVANVADGLGAYALNLLYEFAAGFLSGEVEYVPILIGHHGPFSQFSIRSTVALTGGTPLFDASVYEIASNGSPGRRLINFSQITAFQAIGTYTSGAIAVPVHLVPGWYWQAALFQAGGATGAFSPNQADYLIGGPVGSLTGISAAVKRLSTQTVLSDPATAPTGVGTAKSVALLFK